MKKSLAVIAIWLACAPCTYLLLKRSWIRPHRDMFDYTLTSQRDWTLGSRHMAILITTLGPTGLAIAVGMTVLDQIPETDPNEKASW